MSENFILGGTKKGQHYSVDINYQHIFLVAPTGAGKGVSTIIPNLLSWQESIIMHDIKGENFKITSGWRASQGQKIFVWKPTDINKKTHRFNPLDFISSNSDEMINDIQKIVYIICNKNDKSLDSQVRNLLTGIICYLSANTAKEKTFGEVVRILMNNPIEELQSGIDKFKDKIHKSGIYAIKLFLNQEEKSIIISTLFSYLEVFTNPLIDYATSASDFDIANFKKEKTTLYVILEPNEIKILEPLMQFFYQYALIILTKGDAVEKENSGVMFIMDEFTTVGKMPNFLNAIAYARGYHVKLLLIAPDIEQIRQVYGEYGANLFFYNTFYTICFGTQSEETANFISKLSIDKISPKEIMNLPHNQQIILEYNELVIARKINYYNDESFKNKLLLCAEVFKN